MGERSRVKSALITMNQDESSNADKIAEIMRGVEALEYRDLLRLRDLIVNEVEVAKVRVIMKAREEFENLGVSLEDVMAVKPKRKRASSTLQPATPKYRSPDGKEWSGRGATPKWIREYEASGGQRDDYLIKVEG